MNKSTIGRSPHRGQMGPKEKAENQSATIKRIFSYVTKYKKSLVAIVLLVIIVSALSVTAPYLIGVIIDQYIMQKNMSGAISLILLLASIYIMTTIFNWIETYLMIQISMGTIRDIRQQMFEKMQQLPMRYFDEHSHGDLMSRVTNDVDNLNTALSQSVTQIVSSVLTLVGTAIVMFVLSWQLALVSFSIIPLILFTSRKIIERSGKNYRQRQKDLGVLNGYINENISGAEIVTLFGQEKKSTKAFTQLNENYRQSAKNAEVTSGVLGPINNFINNVGVGAVVGIGSLMVLAQMTTVGTIASFTTYSRQFFRPINQLSNLFNTLQAAIAGAERIFDMMDEQSEFIEEANKKELTRMNGTITFDRVNFSYDGRKNVLKNISFTANEGDMVAIVGPTGSGKTTIINLLSMFYDIEQGQIKINGENLADFKKSNVRKRISIVLQDTFLFKGTIKENIRFGRPTATDAEVAHASEIAMAHQFIKYLPDQYDTEIVSGGTNLSQGERQLIAIARAVLEDADVLILDEATSSVDTQTEMLIQQGLNQLMTGKTSFVIAHRLKTIEQADQIIVIKDGKIAEKGTHNMLMVQNGYYKQLQMQVN